MDDGSLEAKPGVLFPLGGRGLLLPIRTAEGERRGFLQMAAEADGPWAAGGYFFLPPRDDEVGSVLSQECLLGPAEDDRAPALSGIVPQEAVGFAAARARWSEGGPIRPMMVIADDQDRPVGYLGAAPDGLRFFVHRSRASADGLLEPRVAWRIQPAAKATVTIPGGRRWWEATYPYLPPDGQDDVRLLDIVRVIRFSLGTNGRRFVMVGATSGKEIGRLQNSPTAGGGFVVGGHWRFASGTWPTQSFRAYPAGDIGPDSAWLDPVGCRKYDVQPFAGVLKKALTLRPTYTLRYDDETTVAGYLIVDAQAGLSTWALESRLVKTDGGLYFDPSRVLHFDYNAFGKLVAVDPDSATWRVCHEDALTTGFE